MRKFIAVSESDDENLTACAMAEKLFDLNGVICMINDPANICLYKRLDIYQVLSGDSLIKESTRA